MSKIYKFIQNLTYTKYLKKYVTWQSAYDSLLAKR